MGIFVAVIIILVILLFVIWGFMRRRTAPVNRPEADTPQPAPSLAAPAGKPPASKPVVMKRSIHADAVAAQLFRLIEAEFSVPETCTVSVDRVTSEAIYLQIFVIDFATYLSLSEVSEKTAVVGAFWDYVNAAGLDGGTVNARMELYETAIRADSPEETFRALGHAFARACLSPADLVLPQIGTNIATGMADKVAQVLKSVEVLP